MVYQLDKNYPPTADGLAAYLTTASKPGVSILYCNYTLGAHLSSPVTSILLKGVWRFRLTTDPLAKSGLEDFARFGSGARDGEVEDYVVEMPLDLGEWWKQDLFDYGDLDYSTYPTQADQDGARHRFRLDTRDVFLGNESPDSASDGKVGVPPSAANGDDAGGIDDEDGFDPSSVTLRRGASVGFDVVATSSVEARVYGFVDWNGDVDFGDANETSAIAVPAGADHAVLTLPWTVPRSAVQGQAVGVRLRISSDQTTVLGPTGLAVDGEVEDYMVTVSP